MSVGLGLRVRRLGPPDSQSFLQSRCLSFPAEASISGQDPGSRDPAGGPVREDPPVGVQPANPGEHSQPRQPQAVAERRSTVLQVLLTSMKETAS